MLRERGYDADAGVLVNRTIESLGAEELDDIDDAWMLSPPCQPFTRGGPLALGSVQLGCWGARAVSRGVGCCRKESYERCRVVWTGTGWKGVRMFRSSYRGCVG